MAVKDTRPKGQWRRGQVVEEGIQYRGPHQFRVQIRERGHASTKTLETLEAARAWKQEIEQKHLGRKVVDLTLPDRTTVAAAAHWGVAQLLGEDPAKWKNPNDKNHVSRWRWWRDKSPFRLWMLADIKNTDLTRWVRTVLMDDVGDDVEDAEAAQTEVAALEDDDKPVTAQTIIHRLNSFSVLIREWRLANEVPAPLLPNPVMEGVRPMNGKGRRRRLEEAEVEALAKAAAESSRPWLADAVVLAIETAMRQTELATLTWDRVRLDDEHPYVHLPVTKNGRARNVPLSDRAIEALDHLKGLADAHNASPKSERTPRWDKPLPVDSGRGVIHAFRDAVEAHRASDGVGLDDLRWHDLRHEAVSRFFEPCLSG